MEYFAKFLDQGGLVFSNLFEACKIDAYRGSVLDERCYLGVDIALGGKDATTAVILSETGKVLNIERWRDSETSMQIARIQQILKNYNIVGGNIEMNTERGIQQAISKVNPLIKPWQTTLQSKMDAVQNLKKDIEDGTLQLPSPKLDPILYSEMAAYQAEQVSRGIRYTHPSGGHDDSVDALWLANESRMPNRYTNFMPRLGSSIGNKNKYNNFR